MMGRSILAVLTGEDNATYGDDEFGGGEMVGGRWMRKGPYKAVSVAPPYGDGAWELYDVETDPGETENLATDMPDQLAELIDAYERYAEKVDVIE
jgi:arylsulfatase A-like enzyme